MTWATLRSLVAGLFRRHHVEADMAAEIEFHIETRARDLVARGMNPEVARRTARIEFGAIERYKEEVRGARGDADPVFEHVPGVLGRELHHAPLVATQRDPEPDHALRAVGEDAL